MTLDNFIKTKPAELRLGQYFYNTFFARLKPHDNTHKNMDYLYNTRDEASAKAIIQEIMKAYQWEELPSEHIPNL